jgi:hypothetical protein
MSGVRKFSDAVMNAVSPETRKSLIAFGESIARAEGVLREYHAALPSAFTGQAATSRATIRENARLVFTRFHHDVDEGSSVFARGCR